MSDTQTNILPDIYRIVNNAERAIEDVVGYQVKLNFTLPPQHVHLKTIRQEICDVFGVKWTQVSSPSKERNLVTARFLFCYYCRNRLNMTLKAIGEKINRDHTSVLHALQKIKDLISTGDPLITDSLERLDRHLGNHENLKT